MPEAVLSNLLVCCVWQVRSKQKLHVTVGHVTVMADIQLFGLPDGEGEPAAEAIQAISSRIGRLALKVCRHTSINRGCHVLQGIRLKASCSALRSYALWEFSDTVGNYPCSS